MGNGFGEIVVALPDWVEGVVDSSAVCETDDARMKLAVLLARENARRGGGPFGAAVFEAGTGRVVAPGVNLVVERRCSILHAEMVAIALAEARIGSHTMAVGAFELFSSSEPCAQCLGAVCWSGVGRLVCGAEAGDAVAIGFEEGPRRDDWKAQLEGRGIRVECGLLAAEAREVLSDYARRGGPIYNGRPR
jgi:tRNA(Arg) A34 adenosine deaminase TadA